VDNVDSFVYAVGNDYKLMSFNQKMASCFTDLKVGDYCYKALNGTNEPCVGCPVLKNGASSFTLFSQKLNTFLSANHA